MNRSRFTLNLGLIAAAFFVSALLVVNASKDSTARFTFLKQGEKVYSGKGIAKLAGLTTTETFVNVPMNWEDVVAKVQKEIPTAIFRKDEDGPYFVIPQMQSGRVLVSEFPEQSITVRPGKLTRVGARMMVRADSGSDWAHVLIQDFRQPSPLESAFNWLGDRLGI